MLLVKVMKEHLRQALTSVAGIVERKQTMPILSNVVLREVAGRLELTGSDGIMQIKNLTDIECAQLQPGITVSARLLQDVLRAIQENIEVTLDFNESKSMLEITCKNARFHLQTLSAASYPYIEQAKEDKQFQLEQKHMREAIALAHIAMASHDLRYYLNGLLIDIGPQGAAMVATDGHRLAIYQLNQKQANAQERSEVIIPRKTVMEILRLLEVGEQTVQVSISGTQMTIKMGQVTLITNLIEGKFPDYRKIIPKNNNKIAEVDRRELLAALQRTSVVSNEKHRGVSVGFKPGELELTSINNDQEQAHDSVPMSYEDQAMEMGFNSQYLTEVLGALTAEKIQIALHDVSASAVISAQNEPNFTYILMPMRI